MIINRTLTMNVRIVTNLKNDIFATTQLHHHVASLPVHIPRLVMMVLITKCMGLMTTMTMTMMMTMMMMTGIADSTVDDPRGRIA